MQKEVSLYSDVLELIAQQVQRNIRELEGSLNRVIAYAKLLRAAPTVELAARAMENLTSKEPARTPRLLLEAVADAFQLTPEDLIGPARDKETVTARRVAMHLLRQETNFSLSQIGQELGGRDAAAVSNASKRVTLDSHTNPHLKEIITEIQQKIHTKKKN